jgi:hypothetical protein
MLNRLGIYGLSAKFSNVWTNQNYYQTTESIIFLYAITWTITKVQKRHHQAYAYQHNTILFEQIKTWKMKTINA